MMLLEWVCTAVFLILVVLALRAALGRRISAGLRYALWAVVLLRLLVPVQLFTSPIAGTWVVTEKRMEHSVTKAPSAPSAPGDAPALGGQHVPALEVGQGGEPGFLNPPIVPNAPEPPEVPVPPAAPDLTRFSPWLGWTWLAGAGVAALVLLLSNLRFYGRLRRARTRLEGPDCPLAVYAAPGLPSPCLFGLFRPAVYVTPETAVDSAMLRHVLAHEYTHYKHGDHIWSLLRCAALAVHWWNPLVWLAAGLSRRDAELACDEGAIKRLGDGERAAYGGTLLSLVTAKPGPSDLFRCATTMAGDKKRLKERITRIAQAPKRWLWAAVAVVLVTALACLCAFGQGPQETEQDPVHTEGPSAQPAEEQWTDIPELLAKFPVNAADAPEDVVHFAGQVVQERYTTYLDYLRENPVSDEPIQFDGWRVDGLNGPWRGTVRDMELEVWSINYLFHTTTPKEAENLIVGGNYLTEDGWLCPTYPNCTYVIFQVNGAGELNFLTAEMINDCSPDGASGMFFETVAAALGRKGLADFHSGPDLGGVPEDVAQAAKGRVQAAYNNWRGDTSLKGTPQFDDWRIYDLTGPWEEATETARFEVWRLGYEIHTTTPDRVKVMDGMSLHPDGWFRPAQPDSLYLLFTVKDGGRTYLTDISSTDCGPGDPEFHDLLERLGGRLVVPENLPETDLNRNGVPETPRLALIDGGTGQRLELWEEGKLIFSEEGYFSHAGYNALFLYHSDDGDYLLRYNPYMGQGWGDYSYELFTLSPTGEEVTAREGYVEFDINFQSPANERFNPKAIAEFMEEVNGMLADSVQLLNTDMDLLDTFRKEGRLYHSLGWLDGWEPVFDRDESRSLEDNLRAFQVAMSLPVVRSMDLESDELILAYRGKETKFQALWHHWDVADVEKGTLMDLDKDGREEIAVILTMGRGTGCLVQNLYAFDAETLEQYDTSGLNEQILGGIKSTGDEENFYLSASWMDRVAVPKDEARKMNEYVPVAETLALGEIIEYIVEKDGVHCRLGCDASGSAVNYIGYLDITLGFTPREGFRCVSARYAPAGPDDPWGLVLTASSATPTGLTLTFNQSGGQPTGSLQYDSKYWLERKDGEGWTRMSASEQFWTLEAYTIPMGGQTSQEVDWSWLYGQLPPGRYRIGKEVMDFRKTGDYDTQDYYAEFEVK